VCTGTRWCNQEQPVRKRTECPASRQVTSKQAASSGGGEEKCSALLAFYRAQRPASFGA